MDLFQTEPQGHLLRPAESADHGKRRYPGSPRTAVGRGDQLEVILDVRLEAVPVATEREYDRHQRR